MYLNLDLLYNVDKYFYPLFYYKYINFEVYCPITKKSVYISPCYSICYDFITKKRNWQSDKNIDFNDTKHIITENTITWKNIIYKKCKPFKLNSEDLYFLKSNTRIN